MPRRQPSRLVDQHGRPMGYYEAARRHWRTGDNPNWYLYNSAVDWKTLSNGDFKSILNSARYLFNNFPIIRGAIQEQINYTLPLTPQYVGPDREWGEEAEAFLREWHKIASVHGPQYDRSTCMATVLTSVKVDGDIGTVLVNANGFPQIQFVRAHRIAGEDKGRNLHLGVRINRFGRAVAYRIDDEQDISAANMFLTYCPHWPDQTRGLSHFVASINDFSDMARLREYEMRAQQMAASIGIIEHNELGEADSTADNLAFPDSTDTIPSEGQTLTTEVYDGGATRYFRSNSGENLTAFNYDRPGANSLQFTDKIISAALYGIGWDPNFSQLLNTPGGAWARIVVEKVRRQVARDQEMLGTWARRVDGYALAVAIKNGYLPAPPSGNWWSWRYQGPARLTADSGNEERIRLEKYKMGSMTLSDLGGEGGFDWQEKRAQRQAEVEDLLQRANDLATRYGITVSAALGLLEQRNPNFSNEPTSSQDPEQA